MASRPLSLTCTFALLALGSACAGNQKPAVEAVGDVCGPQGEAACIARTEGNASRAGQALGLRLANGERKTFTDNAAACGEGEFGRCAVYRLEGYRPAEGLYLLESIRGARRGHAVVDRRSGAVVETVTDRPRFSPSGRRFFGITGRPGGDGTVEANVWSLGDGTPAVEWTHVIPGSARAIYEFEAWRGDDAVALKATYSTTAGARRVEAVTVSRGEAGWVLNKPDDAP